MPTRLTRDDAWTLLCEWTKGEPLRRHALEVEKVMRAAAHRYGPGAEAEEQWAVTGLLHDADYEAWPDEHPRRIVARLNELGEEQIAYAISTHYTQSGLAHNSQLDKALLACDELTGFIGAVCLVRPDGITSLKPKSVKKKLKDKSFAAKVDRGDINLGVELLGVDLGEHIAFVIDALRGTALD